MKAWTILELENLLRSLRPLVGLRLQEIQTTMNDVLLGFYSGEGILWLWIDLGATAPALLPWMSLPIKPEVQKTPLHLFLKAHFVGRTLREIHRTEDQGRVVTLQFGGKDDALEIEVRLIPHRRNMIARTGHKKISWQKAEALPLSEAGAEAAGKVRTLDELREEWLESRGQKRKLKPQEAVSPLARIERDLAKKKSALKKVHEELLRKKELPWKEIGDWLKEHQSVDVPAEWEPFVDRRRKLSWNIEQCYSKAREGSQKILGTEKRAQILEDEIRRLEEKVKLPAHELKSQMPVATVKPSLAKMEAQGRTLHLENGMTAVMGKSAVDNLKILRKARAWDLWFHLKDYPSSHAVLFRNKNAATPDAILFEVASWFVRNHLGAKAAQHAGEKFDLIVTECRYVRPIKGDKIGRVNYHDERLLIYQFPG